MIDEVSQNQPPVMEPPAPTTEPNQSAQPAVPVTPAKKKPGKGLIIGLVALFLTVIGVSGYMVWEKNKQQEPTTTPMAEEQTTPTPTPDPTADWETYTDLTYNFEIRYPRGYSVSGNLAESLDSWKAGQGISITSESIVGNPKIFIEAVFDGYGPFFPSGTIDAEFVNSQLVINSITKVTEEEYQSMVDNGNIQEGSELLISKIIQHNNVPFWFNISYNGGVNPQLEETLKQILSTFRFLDEKKAEPISHIITIPADWQEFSGTDPQLKLTTTLSVPPGFTFGFSGSEWRLFSPPDESWDYTTSVLFSTWLDKCDKENDEIDNFTEYTNSCCLEKIANYYEGGSRRQWYQKYLNGDFSCTYPASAAKTGEIISVTEEATGTNTYLKILVKNAFTNKSENHYIYVQNDILHIIKPISDKALNPDYLIAKNIAIILSSIHSTFEN